MVIDDFLSPEELETWRERVDRAVASRTGRTPSQLAGNKLFDSDPDDFVKGRPNEADLEKNSQGNAGYYASVFTQCLQLHMSDEGMYELMVDPSIGKMAAELAGVQGIRIWHDQALIKEPWANPTGWHLGDPTTPHPARSGSGADLRRCNQTIRTGASTTATRRTAALSRSGWRSTTRRSTTAACSSSR